LSAGKCGFAFNKFDGKRPGRFLKGIMDLKKHIMDLKKNIN
jgi:hypothetical protein